MALDTHTAAGPLAGSLYQPIRALWWLAQSDKGASVGIEVLDDISCYSAGALIALEQDKNSLTPHSPLTNRSVDLWKTLSIWLGAIKDGEVIAEEVEFYLVTNRSITGGWVKDLKDSDKTSAVVSGLVEKLRKIGKKPSESLRDHVEDVLSFSDHEISTLLSRIVVEDASTGSSGDELKSKTISKLHIPDGYPDDLIYNGLLGWLITSVIYSFEIGEEAIIPRSAFSRALVNLLDEHHEKRFRERAARLLSITPEERDAEKNRLFVQQLLLLRLRADSDDVLEAIDEMIRRRKEFTRFAKEGSITEVEINSFEDRVFEKWKIVAARNIRSYSSGQADLAIKVGLDILDECREHRESLAGQPTEEYYLTRGTFHFLANQRINVLPR